MALQIQYTDPNTGVVSSQAYAKIEYVNVADGQKTAHVAIYHNESTRLGGFIPLVTKAYQTQLVDFSLSYAEMYTYLKTLPEFAGALDV